MRDYGHALELEPGLAPAALNRGIVAYKSGRYDDAITDFHRALHAASDPPAIGRIQFNLALAYAARGDRLEALAAHTRPSPAGTPKHASYAIACARTLDRKAR